MFVQVIQGTVADAAGLDAAMDRWFAELKPAAVENGYLGSTQGTTEDGTFIALVRFESASAAQANSGRAEQDAWWAEASKCFDGEASYTDCDGAQTWLDGGSDDAGFVQVMQGRSSDVARMHELMSSHSDEVRSGRPEILGGLMLDAGDGKWIDAIYFTSESAARGGEQQEMPPEIRAQMDEAMGLMSDITYLDLKNPRLDSA